MSAIRSPSPGPLYGRFSFHPLRDEPVLLLASGTGLPSMKAIIRHIWESGSEHEVVLYHGVATVEELYDREWFEDLEAEVDWFSYQPAVSREEYGGRSGRVPALLAEDYPKAGGNVAYICGSPDMVADTMKALMKARLFPRNIDREDFLDSADRANGTDVVRSPLTSASRATPALTVRRARCHVPRTLQRARHVQNTRGIEEPLHRRRELTRWAATEVDSGVGVAVADRIGLRGPFHSPEASLCYTVLALKVFRAVWVPRPYRVLFG